MRLEGDNSVTLFADSTRKLPETDPYDRQITIGLGCFLEVARMAAAVRGYALDVEAFPKGEPHPRLDGRPVARLRFEKTSIAVDPLFAHLPKRRSTKVPYDMSTPVAGAVIPELLSVIPDRVRGDGTTDPERVADLAVLAWQGHVVECTTPAPIAKASS